MTVKVSGFTNIGEHLTGNIDFFTITTLVPCLNTGVSKPLQEIKSDLGISSDISTKGGVTIFNTTYNNDNEYTDAFNKQINLDRLIQIVQQRAQPIMLNATDIGSVSNVSNEIPSGSHASDFGTTYSGNSGNPYLIKFAVEHEGIWSQNELADEVNGRDILDLTMGVIVGTNQFDTISIDLLNTVVLKNEFL